MEMRFLPIAVVCAVVAALWDMRSGRIPNRLSYGVLLAGLVARFYFGGWRAAADGLVAALVCGGIFLLFFLMGGMGAGDVKLIAAIGCWAGIHEALIILMATAIAGALLALGYMVFHRQSSQTLRNLGSLVRFHLVSGLKPHPDINLQSSGTLKIPYALAIAVGTAYAMGLLLLRR